ncbi:hypothetical protein WJW32_03775 [Tepidibacter sp. Z1-5]
MNVFFYRVATPSIKDYIIHIDVTLKSDTFFIRKITLAIYKVCNVRLYPTHYKMYKIGS